tara:strand:- start:955 stop:1083 length:129 start_codon:yes stop_codon:yes gene_type:complete
MDGLLVVDLALLKNRVVMMEPRLLVVLVVAEKDKVLVHLMPI